MGKSKREEIQPEVVRLLGGGADMETLLGFMRERGLDQMDSLLTLVDVVGLDTGEAYDLILDSRTWSDQRENNLRLHQTLIQALQELSQEQDPNFKIEIEPDPDSPER